MAEPYHLDVMSLASVRIEIDGPWELPEFGKFMEAMHACYGILLVAHQFLADRDMADFDILFESRVTAKSSSSRPRRSAPKLEQLIDTVLRDPSNIRTQPLEDERILLVAAHFASPGFIKFLGLRQLMERLRNLCHVAAHYEAAKREIELDHSRVELERSKLTLMREKMRLYREALEMPLPEADKRALLKAITSTLRPIESAAAHGLITGSALTLE